MRAVNLNGTGTTPGRRFKSYRGVESCLADSSTSGESFRRRYFQCTVICLFLGLVFPQELAPGDAPHAIAAGAIWHVDHLGGHSLIVPTEVDMDSLTPTLTQAEHEALRERYRIEKTDRARPQRCQNG